MKNVLITGATSFIGINLIKYLSSSKYKIYVIVRPNSPNVSKLGKFNDIKFVYLDIRDISKLQNFVQHIDICFHLAWEGTRAYSRLDENLQHRNYVSSIKLYEAVKKLGCVTFFGIGSQAEYGVCSDLITEDILTEPSTAYGKYKLETCNKIMSLSKADGVRFIWGRVFSIYGKGDNDKTLIMSTISRMLNNEDINMTEGTQYWNYLYVEDLARIMVSLLENEDANGVYNLANDDTRMLRNYILELKRVLKSESNVNFGTISYGKEGKISIRPCISRLQRVIEISDFTSFEIGIKKIFN